MESILFKRIKELCEERGISIQRLESEIGVGASTINKWAKSKSPTAERVLAVAKYFDVSVDYLLGTTDIKVSISSMLSDEDIVSFQRAREKMSDSDKERMMQMLRIGFDYAFREDDTN